MSPLTISRTEHSIQRPTSDDVMYDIRRDYIGEEVLFHENFRTPLANTMQKLNEISSWQENWNGHGAAKPKMPSILRALRWVADMRVQATLTRNPWIEPHVVSDEDGDIVFEWSRDSRTLSIYVSPHAVEYLKVVGPDIYADMQDGIVATSEDNQDLWRWLMGQE